MTDKIIRIGGNPDVEDPAEDSVERSLERARALVNDPAALPELRVAKPIAGAPIDDSATLPDLFDVEPQDPDELLTAQRVSDALGQLPGLSLIESADSEEPTVIIPNVDSVVEGVHAQLSGATHTSGVLPPAQALPPTIPPPPTVPPPPRVQTPSVAHVPPTPRPLPPNIPPPPRSRSQRPSPSTTDSQIQ